jgi:alpha-2-macroglobulin
VTGPPIASEFASRFPEFILTGEGSGDEGKHVNLCGIWLEFAGHCNSVKVRIVLGYLSLSYWRTYSMYVRPHSLKLMAFLFSVLAMVAADAVGQDNQASQSNLQIIRVTPDGEDVPAEKQIVITFDRDVVPLGRMNRNSAEIPVKITPAVQCEWRWINTSALACNLPDASPLQQATRYTLDISPDIKTEDGATLATSYHHTFLTERAAIDDYGFNQWRSPSLPVLRLVFNQPVTQQSVADHLFFGMAGRADVRIPAKVSPDPEDRVLPEIMPVPGGSGGAVVIGQQPPQKSDDRLQVKDGGEARRIWLIEPLNELAADATVVLKAEPGLVSAAGPEASVAASDVVQFNTFPAFELLGVRCANNAGEEVKVAPGETPSDTCNPMQPVYLSFSAPVERETLGDALAFNPPIGGWKQPSTDDQEGEPAPDTAPATSAQLGVEYRQAHEKGRTYDIWLPSPLRAAQTYTVKSGTVPAKDIFGRIIGKPIAQSFALDHRKPNFVLDYTDAVLEKNVDSEVPLYVNNLQNFTFDYRRLTPKGSDDGHSVNKTVPTAQDVQFAMPLGVREMLDGGTGAVYGALKTTPGVNPESPPHLFAQVTPFQVHLKLGHFNTVAWVTDMTSGAPVAGAKVSLFKDTMATIHAVADVTSVALTDEFGLATLPGTDTLDPDLALTSAYGDDKTRYFLRVDKDGDMALLPVSQSFIIDNYRSSGSESVFPTNRERYGHMRVWGTTAQGIYRAGDLIQYKIFVRDQNNDAFTPPPVQGYRLKVIDPMGKVVHDVYDVELSAFGGTSGEFTAPKEGAVGWYKFKLIAKFAQASPYEPDDSEDVPDEATDESSTAPAQPDDSAGKKSWVAMRVLVSDFTPSPFKVSNQLNGDLFRSGDQVEVTTHAELFSGGAYTDAATRITAILDAAPFSTSDPVARDFTFDSYEGETNTQQIFQKIDSVNNKGELALTFTTGAPKIVYGKLLVESAVADDRGKYVTSQAHADFLGVDRLVGLYSKDWLLTVGTPADIQYVVVDERGKPASATDVALKIEHEVTKSARVKGAGNAYLTEYHIEWEAAGTCNGVSEAVPLTCTFTPAKSGSYRAVAAIKDSKGVDHSTTLNTYATGSDYVMWDNGSDSSLSIIPQSTSYKVGDTARYLVKNPFPGAKALVTIERFGVIDRFVQTLDSSTPIVEFKVKADYVPGFYLSVVIVSPRVEQPLGEGQVDLGKPTFRMGYVTVPVSDPYKDMMITAKSDKDVYKPRDMVKVTLHAAPRFKEKEEPVELTVVALDESVLALVTGGANYFDPYRGFYKLDSLDLRNYSLLTRLVGRQRFEKKGANPGGDGGVDVSMRSLFKFVGYWNAGLKTDKDGNATISFEAPDNLTGWRILAIATTPTDRFGLGGTSFKVNRPTEIRPVMPNQVVEGDTFDAGFSVMNRTDKPRTIDVSIHAKGNLDTEKTPADFSTTVQLDAYKRTTVSMPVAATATGMNRLRGGQIEFEVTAGDSSDRDGLAFSLPVNKRQGLELAATYGTSTQNSIEVPIVFPKDMLPNLGSVSVVAAPTVIGNISGAFRYMEFYPYLCWEQRLSKAVMAAHFKDLKPYLPVNQKWAGSETLPQGTLDIAASFQAPNGGMAYFRAQDDYADPYLSAYTALAFNWMRSSGYRVPEQVEAKLQAYLSALLKNDAVPSFYTQGMTSTVRAVALAALAEQGKAGLADLERYAPHAKDMSLFGKAHFLMAALKVEGGEKYAPALAKMILAASNQTGGKFVFSEVWDDSYSRILASPLRENCAVLDAFVAYGQRDTGKRLVGDVPFKLVRTITQDRKNRDYWQTTQENLFCGSALVDFARVYEADKVNMVVKAAIDGKTIGAASFTDQRNPAVTFARANKEVSGGSKTSIKISREGTGRLYYSTRLTYALPLELSQPASAGIEVHREYSVERDGKWQLLAAPAAIKRGELVRVDLYLSVPAARNFVVVDDPVPGGLEPVNRDLATTSEVDARKADFAASGGSIWFKYDDWIDFDASRWSFYHQELRHESARFFSDYLPPGNYHLSYAAQAIASGSFTSMPTMAQEMYDPDVFGKTEGMTLHVGAADPPPAPQP